MAHLLSKGAAQASGWQDGSGRHVNLDGRAVVNSDTGNNMRLQSRYVQHGDVIHIELVLALRAIMYARQECVVGIVSYRHEALIACGLQ